ncbi:hypothetical protein LZ32DRAFT_603820 [Colletotrichum eremochloae]|nr:hypothetical protein LZ32DRAFT_603820 [Colletotrichum eremochloae]
MNQIAQGLGRPDDAHSCALFRKRADSRSAMTAVCRGRKLIATRADHDCASQTMDFTSRCAS